MGGGACEQLLTPSPLRSRPPRLIQVELQVHCQCQCQSSSALSLCPHTYPLFFIYLQIFYPIYLVFFLAFSIG
jgi:hypothetical protein